MMRVAWSVVCVAALWSFVFSTVFFLLRAFPARGVFDGRSSWKWGAALVASFALWIVGMIRA
jgi:hypothetical protein